MPYAEAPGGGRAPVGRARSSPRPRVRGAWLTMASSSACRRSAPTWRPGTILEWRVKPGDDGAPRRHRRRRRHRQGRHRRRDLRRRRRRRAARPRRRAGARSARPRRARPLGAAVPLATGESPAGFGGSVAAGTSGGRSCSRTGAGARRGHRRPAPVHPQPHVVSPLVRHLAETRHLDIDHLRGSGAADGSCAPTSSVSAAPSRQLRARRLAAERGIDWRTRRHRPRADVGTTSSLRRRTPRPARPTRAHRHCDPGPSPWSRRPRRSTDPSRCGRPSPT